MPQTLQDVLSAPVIVCRPEDEVAVAVARMQEGDTGSVVVVDDDRVVGIITERDILGLIAGGADPGEEPVRRWMSASPVVMPPDVDVAEAFEELSGRGFRHLPVTDDGRLVGIVSIRDLLPHARIQPVEHPGELEAPKGLEGVVVAETEIGDVRGREGFYHYRQYPAPDLARHCTLEQVWHLLFNGHLPDDEELERFRADVAARREIPPRTSELLADIAASGAAPLDGLRSAVSLVGTELGFASWMDISASELHEQALTVTAVVPSLVMALYRLGQGDAPVAPDPDLPYAADYLRMLTGQVPNDDVARAIEQYLISTIDHGFNASTFTARVITSTGADIAAAVVGAIGALSGPLHGGAPSRALDLLDEVGSPDRADEVVRAKVEQGERIMGFGHRVYKTEDPRSRLLREVAQRLGGERTELAVAVEQTVVDVLAELKPGRELYANVEYYAGIVLDRVGLPPELFTPTFAASRSIGWCAHVLEQAADNRIIRPSARYSGTKPRPYRP